ncbi:hypothetical protein BGX27_009358 [Mortierella sp. AM989]|nr:hypothetical protein BGX27_009358 [Mortierella sp. AM989]
MAAVPYMLSETSHSSTLVSVSMIWATGGRKQRVASDSAKESSSQRLRGPQVVLRIPIESPNIKFRIDDDYVQLVSLEG